MYKFLTPDLSDKRIHYAANYLQQNGCETVTEESNADFVLLGVNPDRNLLHFRKPIFAGNIRADNVFDYTKDETFALKNAYLTAEGALSLAVNESSGSLINAKILIVGYGRIGKALHYYLSVFTNRITVCARNSVQLATATALGADTVSFSALKIPNEYNYIFNTVPHPVFNEQEHSAIGEGALLIDLASFPGGVDKHFAKAKGINLLVAPGLPAKYSPKAAGEVVGSTVWEMIKEVII